MSLLVGILVFLLIFILLAPIKSLFPARDMHKLLKLLRQDLGRENTNKALHWDDQIIKMCDHFYKKWNPTFSKEKLDKYKDYISISGLSEKISVEAFMGFKIFCPLVIIAFCTMLLLLIGLNPNILILIIIMPVIAYSIPDLYLISRIKKRQWQLQVDLPNVLNTLAIITDAGLGLKEAMIKVCEIRKGVLVDELKKVDDEINIGILPRDAFLRMSERCKVTEISIFVFAIIHNQEKGAAGITKILKEQAKEVWEKRQNKARELGEKASMKLFLPMLILVFPCLLVFLMGPAVVSLLRLLIK